MDAASWSYLLRPFIMLLLFAAVVIPLKIVFVRYFPEGKLKRLLLLDIHKKPPA